NSSGVQRSQGISLSKRGGEVLSSIPVLPRGEQTLIDVCHTYVDWLANTKVLHIFPTLFGAELCRNLNGTGVVGPRKNTSGGHVVCVVRHRVIDFFVVEGLAVGHRPLIFGRDLARV